MTLSLGHLVPLGNENRWSDLLAVLVENDAHAASRALQLNPPLCAPRAHREARGSGKDRMDLVVHDGEALRVLIEVKVLSGLARRQLDRYREAQPDAGDYLLIFPERLPLSVPADAGWRTLTWDAVLAEFAGSGQSWVAETAAAWLQQLRTTMPVVNAETRWNDLRDGEDFVIALRARMSWVATAVKPPEPIVHDLVESSAGVSWVARMYLPARRDGYEIRVEAEENLPVRDFPKYVSAASRAPRGPSIKVCLVQTGVTTSAGFDWEYLLDLWQVMRRARNDWVTAPPRPKAAHDRAGWQRIVSRGAPKFLGIGFGEAEARRSHECMFGARFQVPPDATLQRTAEELAGCAQMMIDLAAA